MTEYFQVSSNLQKQRIESVQMTDEPSLPKLKTVDVMSDRASATITRFTFSWIYNQQTNNSEQQGWRYYVNHTHFRRLVICMISICFTVYGVTILTRVVSHFDYAVPYCNNLVTQFHEYYDQYEVNDTERADVFILDKESFATNPELFLWESCSFKVYPFDTTCDCRIFRFADHRYYHINDVIWPFHINVIELKEVFNVDILQGLKQLMTTFRMLEKFEIGYSRSLFDEFDDLFLETLGITSKLNLTDHEFSSKKLQVLSINGVPTTQYLSSNIGDLQYLQYLSIESTEIVHFPDSIGDLKMLQYLKLRGFEVGHQTESLPPLCSLTRLRHFETESSGKITELPYCLAKIDTLEIIGLKGMISLNNISMDIFKLPNLRVLNLELTASLFLDDLLSPNNINENSEFIYNPNARFELTTSGLCSTANDSIYKTSFLEFINKTGACDPACSEGGYSFALECSRSHWQNGVCDNECNHEECGYDGGDCLQLCPFDNIETGYLELGNGECNMDLNISECNYDNCDCIPGTYYFGGYGSATFDFDVNRCIPKGFDAELCNLTFSQGLHGCDVEWVNDGWCDINCINVDECGNDGNDCDIGSKCLVGSHCASNYELFDNAANLITQDDLVSPDELCAVWSWISVAVNASISDCTEAMVVADSDNDGYVSYKESNIQMRSQWKMSLEKVHQVDCSECLW